MTRAMLLLALAGCAAPEPDRTKVPDSFVRPPEPPPDGRPLAEQVRSAEGQRWYELALGWFNKGDFDKAKEAARRAVQVDPDNLAARKLLNDIHSIVGGGGPIPTPAEHDVRVAQVAVEQAQIEIAKHVVDGRRYLGARMYESARKEFEAAELKIRALPYDVASLNAMLPEIRAGIASTRR
jgi:tetratricopeptide (TPR) repeat protein